MKKVTLKVGGMTCSGCSSGLQKYLNKQEGVISANVNLVLGEALIEYEDSLKISDLERFIKEAGFESLGLQKNNEEDKKDYRKLFLILFGLLAVFVLYLSMGKMIGIPMINIFDMDKEPLQYTILLFGLTLLFLIYGRDILIGGIKSLFHKMPNMDTLVMLGVGTSFLYSVYNMIFLMKGDSSYVHNLYFESCIIIIYFIKLGRFIDRKGTEKTKEALQELVQITPKTALLKTNDGEKEISIDEVKKGDILICKPGMKVAVDGTIVKGDAYLDEAFITGESLPVKKKNNDKVISGSFNLDGYIEYQAINIGKDSMISEIVRLVSEATNNKTKIEKIADTVSSYFAGILIVIAVVTLIVYLILGYDFSTSLKTFVTVLVVACPCALGLATPLAIVTSEGVCAKNGILVKKGTILEKACQIDTIVFDKTGTLTYGNLRISKIFNYRGNDERKLMELAVSIEEKVSHPIALAFTSYGREKKIKKHDVKEFESISGIGIKGIIDEREIYLGNNKLFKKLKIENTHEKDEELLSKMGNSIVYVIEDKKVIGLIGVNDILRKDAKSVVQKLQKLGKEVMMLTGDNEETSKIIGESVGIDKIISNVLPKEKTDVIKKLIGEGKKVMMVGDGINDAPSLATSTIGVSIGSGTDIAGNSSDVILMNDKLSKIISLLVISKKTMANIRENLFWAFFYNSLMIPIAIDLFRPLGITMNPMFAGIAMTISSLTVVLNSLRLKRYRDRESS